MLQGRPDEGMTLYRRALAIEPDYPEALSKLGLALAERGLWAEAITPLRRAVYLDPRFAEARHNLALTLALSGDQDGARREIEEARRLGFEPPPVDLFQHIGDLQVLSACYESLSRDRLLRADLIRLDAEAPPQPL